MLQWDNRSQRTRLPTSFHHQIPSLSVAVTTLCQFLPVNYQRSLCTVGRDPIPSLPLRNFIVLLPIHRIIPASILQAPVSPNSRHARNKARLTSQSPTHAISSAHLLSRDSQKGGLQTFTTLHLQCYCTSPQPSPSHQKVTKIIHSIKPNEQFSSLKKQ